MWERELEPQVLAPEVNLDNESLLIYPLAGAILYPKIYEADRWNKFGLVFGMPESLNTWAQLRKVTRANDRDNKMAEKLDTQWVYRTRTLLRPEVVFEPDVADEVLRQLALYDARNITRDQLFLDREVYSLTVRPYDWFGCGQSGRGIYLESVEII